MATKLNYKDVVEYFDEVSEDMAELVLSLINEKMDVKAARKAKIVANLKKARAAKGTKTTDSGQANGNEAVAPTQTGHVIADPAIQAEVAAQIPVAPRRGPGRPARVDPNVELSREQSA